MGMEADGNQSQRRYLSIRGIRCVSIIMRISIKILRLCSMAQRVARVRILSAGRTRTQDSISDGQGSCGDLCLTAGIVFG